MTAPPIVLIHGLWITAASWDGWAERYRAAGHEVLAPAWPRMEGTVDELRRDPSGIARLTVPEVLDHLEAVARGCSQPPILMGHSFGGLVVQLLLDRGVGRTGVALHPAAPRGIYTVAPSTLQALWPILRNPRNRSRPAAVTPEGFHASAANAMDAAAARAAWEREIVPAPGRFVFDLAMANTNPRTPLRVDWKRRDRAPLLLVAGGADRMATPKFVQSLARRQTKSGPTQYREFAGRSHYVNQPGWEDVADAAREWAVAGYQR